MAARMSLTYFKRFRMEISLPGRDFSFPRLPAGYRLFPWAESLLEAHAEAKYLSFRSEIDANVFPCLGELAGCHRLMHEIRMKEGFLPQATWLALYDGDSERTSEYCGTVQGIRDASGFGAIQNLGITPDHRGRGLGTILMHRALEGFRAAGLRRAFLEVTAQNDGAIRLYERIGFSRARTVYKAVEVVYT
jgi:ribosomal protein S18 acetylase RimI-like enzyme